MYSDYLGVLIIICSLQHYCVVLVMTEAINNSQAALRLHKVPAVRVIQFFLNISGSSRHRTQNRSTTPTTTVI